MRIGENPARNTLPAYHPEPIGIALLVYIPEEAGYFEQSLQVLSLQIDSLRANTQQPYNLLVFDNGSSAEVKEVLQKWQALGRFDWLIASRHNLGKTGAINWIFGAMPNEMLVFSDCDVFFRQGWLEESLSIFQAFPKAGMVSAQPCFYDTLKNQGKAPCQLDAEQFDCFDYTPSREIVTEYVHGLGFGEEVVEKHMGKALPAVRAIQNGTSAVLAAAHIQFMIPRDLARQILPLPAEWALSPEEDKVMDVSVDEAGYLHLSTLIPYVYHMGNTYDPELRAELNRARNPHAAEPTRQPSQQNGLLELLASNRRLRPYLRNFYKRLFHALTVTRT